MAVKERDKQLLPIRMPSEDSLIDSDNDASATECTGLIPTPPISEEEAKSYTQIYNIPQPEDKVNNRLQYESDRKTSFDR